MESALWILGTVVFFALLHVVVGPWLDRLAERRAEVKRQRVAFAFMRLYSGQQPRRGR